jgi:oligopeptide/dipeptide ABC transporter ATP-binding protein
MTETSPLLEVENLTTRFHTARGVIGAVEKLTFHVNEGEAIGIVGESGSGKSVTALSILRLVPMPGRIVGGRIVLRETDLLALSEREMRAVRRKHIAMIFQDPSNFLNPIMRIGDQIGEGLDRRELSREGVAHQVIEALQAVHIADPRRAADSYPFQLSGGQQQRSVIAAALARRPSLIIADEPTTALDATVQYQILALLEELQAAINTAIILISHDLAVIASICTRVYVMYAAQLVESGPTASVYRNPCHPYTQGLLGSIIDPLERKETLSVMAGSLPDLAAPPTGCRFHPRCPKAMAVCAAKEPPDVQVAGGHTAKCWLYAREGGVPS